MPRINKSLDERIAKTLRIGVSFDRLVIPFLPISLPGDGKAKLLTLFFVVMLEHHRGITFLFRQGEYATSARSLMRPLLQAALRGSWLSRIASNDEVNQAESDDFHYPGIGKMANLFDKLRSASRLEDEPSFAGMVSKIELLHDFFDATRGSSLRQSLRPR